MGISISIGLLGEISCSKCEYAKPFFLHNKRVVCIRELERKSKEPTTGGKGRPFRWEANGALSKYGEACT